MKKVFDKMILIVIIYIVLFVIIHEALRNFSLYFREWVYIFSVIFVVIGFSIGIYYKISKLQSKKKKIILDILYTIILIVLLGNPITIFLVVFSYQPEHVIERDNKKYVAYVTAFLDTTVHYYEYKNLFVFGNLVMDEYYGKGGFDPIKSKFGNNYKLTSTTYYDKEGNVVNTEYEEKSEPSVNNNIQEVEVPKKEENYYIKDNKCFTSITGETVEIIMPDKAGDIADKEAENPKYQYQSWKTEFYSRGKNKDDYLSIELMIGLSEIDRLYHWDENWKKADYENRIMWMVRLFDENDPLTSLYIFVDGVTGEIIGAGQSSD